MAATSHTNLPSSTHGGFESHGDSHNSKKNYGTYDSGIGSLTSHPYQYDTNNYGAYDNHQQSNHSNDDHTFDFHTLQTNNRSRTMNIEQIHGTTKPNRIAEKKQTDNKQTDAKIHQQKKNSKIQSHQSSMPKQTKPDRSDKTPAGTRANLPSTHQISPPDDLDNDPAAKEAKQARIPYDMKQTKSSSMRAAANKKREQEQAEKRKSRYFPSKLKSQRASSQTDVEQSDYENIKPDPKQNQPKIERSAHSDGEQTNRQKVHGNKKHPHSHEAYRKSRRDDHRTGDNHSSGDEDHREHHRSKSQKRPVLSDTHHDKHPPHPSHPLHPPLPPIRHSRLGPHYDPYLDYPLPLNHPYRRRLPYNDYPYYALHYDRYAHRHLYENADDIPPYLAPYHDPYDPFFDYEKRKTQAKHPKEKNDHHNDHEDGNAHGNGHDGDRDDGARSQASKKSKHKNTNNPDQKHHHNHEELRHPSHWPPGYYPPHYYHGEDALEIWRQERNDYLKKKFKPTIHDVLYSQQWMKSDSYLENQRRRALRDAQGYYFPYKKYTLKDYKDMQKLNNPNPYSELPETTIDRKERAKKRQEYGSLIERQVIEHPHTRHIPPREIQPRKPWHLSSGEPQNSNTTSKRDRALEYAKVQVKYRPVDSQELHSDRADPNDSTYVNNYFLDAPDDDGDESNNQGTGNNHQSYNNYNY